MNDRFGAIFLKYIAASQPYVKPLKGKKTIAITKNQRSILPKAFRSFSQLRKIKNVGVIFLNLSIMNSRPTTNRTNGNKKKITDIIAAN